MGRVLFASDFSRASRKAFAEAVKTSKRAHAELSILHVVVPAVPAGPDRYVGPDTWGEIDKQARKEVKRHLEALAERARKAGVRTNSLLIDGMPGREIPRVARRTHADLVVIGTHGRTGSAKLFLGSIASQVVATATCPVMTVRGR